MVLDSNLCRFYGIGATGTVLMQVHKHELHFYTANQPIKDAVVKNISIGRFNLPSIWAKHNHVSVGDDVFLLATDDELCVYPAEVEV